MSLGGFTMLRNANQLDYCWQACVESLLGVCDTVALSVSPGDDDTERQAREWADREPKLSINMYPWPEPKGNPDWFCDWIQYARMHTPTDWIFQLDADEVLHENSYEEIRRFIADPNQERTGIVTRFNFWSDHKHLIPEGFCCGKRVVRLAPQKLWLASDGYDPRGERAASLAVSTGIQIGHYGFIREPEKFMAKERLLQGYYFNSFDPRLEEAAKAGKDWATQPGVTGWEQMIEPFTGTHPAAVQDWLKQKGYNP